MRPFEFIGWLIAFVPVVALLGIFPVSAGVGAGVVSCGVLIAAAVSLGAYWQLLPMYLGVVLALAGLLLLEPRPDWRRPAMAAAVICLLVLTAAFTCVLPMFSLPKPTGSFTVGTRIVHLVDPVRTETHLSGTPRPREIMVQIWYPATPRGRHLAAYRTRRETTWLSSYMSVLWTHSFLNAPVAADGPFPVLLFNPAWGGQRTQNTYQTEDLASHGFIVAAIDHTYNSGPVAFPDGRVVPTTDMHDIADFHDTTLDQQIAIGDKEVRIEAADDILALNYLARENSDPRSPWFQKVNANDAGAFGHSFGGAVAAQTCYEDSRVKAALNEDGWMFGDVSTHGLEKPYMVMSDDGPAITEAELKSADLQTRREAELNIRDELNMNKTLREFGGYMFTIRGLKHNDFRDRVLYSPLRKLTGAGTISPRLAHQIVEAYTLQFFSHYLQNKPAPLLTSSVSPYKEVQFGNWFAQNALIH